jgi:hypothetical protein
MIDNTTETKEAPAAAPKPVLEEFFAFAISETAYQVTILRPDPLVAKAAYRFAKRDGTVYDVAVRPDGIECSCADYVFRRDGKAGKDGQCKHIRRLLALRKALMPLAVKRKPGAGRKPKRKTAAAIATAN